LKIIGLRRVSLRKRILYALFPWLRRRHEARMQKLMHRAADDPNTEIRFF
jgi:hypothetical protein